MHSGLTVQEIKTTLLNFHKDRGYRLFGSFPLVSTDPTVMFNNATITPFKYWFTHSFIQPKNYVLIQRCLRMGGASDLDSVGTNPYYFTFFEMFGSGSFSITSEEAVLYLLEILMAVGIKKEQLYFTIPIREDFDVALRRNGVEESQIFMLSENGYFWQEWRFGVPGPMGHGLTVIFSRSTEKAGSVEQLVNKQDEYIELLNLILVHSQSLSDGTLVPITNPGFDLGIGIERLATALQGGNSYQIDIVAPLVQKVQEFLLEQKDQSDDSVSRICVDHFRAIYVLLAEGLKPSNKGHGYVLRKLARRFLETIWLSIGKPVSTRGLIKNLSSNFEKYGGLVDVGCTDVADKMEEEENALRAILQRAEQILYQHQGISSQKLHDTYGVSKTLLTMVQRKQKEGDEQ